MKVDNSICLEGGVVAGYRQNISGTLVNSQTRNDFFDLRKRELDYALTESGVSRPYSYKTPSGGLDFTILPARMGLSASTFVIQEAGRQCSVECANDTALCTRLNLDVSNSAYVRALVARFPHSPINRSFNPEFIRHTLRANPGCRRGDVKFEGTRVQNEGQQCIEPLYLDMPGITNFALKLKIPARLSASIEYRGNEQRLTFATPSEMAELQVSPSGANDVLGGRIRFLSSSPNEIVVESENGCIAVSLH